MTNDDLFTDYALQMFSSYMSQDFKATQMLFDSLMDEGKHIDETFMPGVIFGLMYHLKTMMNSIAAMLEENLEDVLATYAVHYAMNRDLIKESPFMNVATAKDAIDELINSDEFISQFLNDEEDDLDF